VYGILLGDGWLIAEGEERVPERFPWQQNLFAAEENNNGIRHKVHQKYLH